MVNLFEQWNDMDFVSTYEPIDWKALNDFANRARQDAKDNADAKAEKLKNLNEMYVTDVNDDFTSEANNYIKSEIERISSLGTNMAPGDFSRDLNKNMNPVLAYQKGAQKQADERRKSVTNLHLTQPQVQAIDESNGSYDPNDGVMRSNEANPFHYLETVDSAIADHVDKSKSDRVDNGITSTETYSPNHWAEDVAMISEDSDIMTGARFKSVLMLNDLGRNGSKSQYYDLLKDHVVLNDDGTIKTTAKGTAILKDDFTGTGNYSQYMFKPKAKGSGFVADEENPISFGKGIDALAREYIYRMGYNRTFGRTDKQLPKDGSKGSGKKDPTLMDDITFTQFVNARVRRSRSEWDDSLGRFSYHNDISLLSDIDTRDESGMTYGLYNEKTGKITLPTYVKNAEGSEAYKLWVNPDVPQEVKAMLLVSGNTSESNAYNNRNSGGDVYRVNFRKEIGSDYIDASAYSNSGLTITESKNTQSHGDTERRITKSAKNSTTTRVDENLVFIPENVMFIDKATTNDNASNNIYPTAVVIDKESGTARLEAGSGVFKNANEIVSFYVYNRIAHSVAPSSVKPRGSYVLNTIDNYSPTTLGVSIDFTEDDFVTAIKDLAKKQPESESEKVAIDAIRDVVKKSRKNSDIMKSFSEIINSKGRAVKTDNGSKMIYTVGASIPTSSTVTRYIDTNASSDIKSSANKPEQLYTMYDLD